MKEINMEGLNETIFYEETKEGLPVYIWQNEKVNGYYLSFSTKFGSIDTEYKVGNESFTLPNGTAHFLEHLKFNEEDGKSAQDFYEEMGSDVNAFTTFDFTSYQVYSTNQMKENLDHLLDFVLTPSFSEKMVKNEKGIIVEENKMDQDNPANKLFFGSYKNIFHKYNHKEYITGDESEIKSTTLEDIENAFFHFYHPENMFLVVTGNVNPYDVIKVVNENLSTKEFDTYKKPKRKAYKEPLKVVKPYHEEKGNVELPKLRYTLKIPKKDFKDVSEVELRVLLSLILNMNYGSTSDFREDLLNKNLVYYFSPERIIYEDYVLISFMIETDYPEEVIKRLDDSLENLAMDETAFKRKIKSAIANMVLSFDDITEVNNMIQDYIMIYGDVVENLKELYESLSVEKGINVIKQISTKEKSIYLIKPKK